MNGPINVYMLPTMLVHDELHGGIAVVIDVLRASTTICHALAAGAKAIVPFEDVDAARRFRIESGGQDVLLGGERFGMRIEGFDLDNSPASYTTPVVAGKTIALTTTNGTRALQRCRNAERIIIGTFANLNSVIPLLRSTDLPIHLVCAGTDGAITSEDCLFAGAIVLGLEEFSNTPVALNDQARIARDFFSVHRSDQKSFLAEMRSSAGGRNLVALGFDSDIEFASQWDSVELVPEYFVEFEQITTASHLEYVITRYLSPPA